MTEKTEKPAAEPQQAAAIAREPDMSCMLSGIQDTAAAPNAPATKDAEAKPAGEPPKSSDKTNAGDKTKAALAEGKSKSGGKTDGSASTTERKEPWLKLPKREGKILAGTASNDEPAARGLAKVATLFGNLDSDQRIRKSAEQNERLLWAGAAGATLIYVLLIASQSMTGLLVPMDPMQQQRERRGQDGNIVSVEIVPEPDLNAKTRKWRDGSDVPTQQQPIPPMPPMPQTAALPEPPNEAQAEAEKEAEAEEKPEKEKPEKDQADKEAKQENAEKPRPDEAPMLLDLDSLVDAAAADLKHQIDRHYESKPQKRQRQAAAASGAMKVRGSGASGKSDPFTDSVIAALMKTRPGPVALWGRVLVTFQISENGKLLYVRVLQSSGNTAMDQAAVSAIRRARFQRPPPGMTADQRTYIIDYIFG